MVRVLHLQVSSTAVKLALDDEGIAIAGCVCSPVRGRTGDLLGNGPTGKHTEDEASEERLKGADCHNGIPSPVLTFVEFVANSM